MFPSFIVAHTRRSLASPRLSRLMLMHQVVKNDHQRRGLCFTPRGSQVGAEYEVVMHVEESDEEEDPRSAAAIKKLLKKSDGYETKMRRLFEVCGVAWRRVASMFLEWATTSCGVLTRGSRSFSHSASTATTTAALTGKSSKACCQSSTSKPTRFARFITLLVSRVLGFILPTSTFVLMPRRIHVCSCRISSSSRQAVTLTQYRSTSSCFGTGRGLCHMQPHNEPAS